MKHNIRLFIILILIIIILFSELYLLKMNHRMKSDYIQLRGIFSDLDKKYKKSLYEDSFEGQCLPLYFEFKDLIKLKNFYRYLLIFYFTTKDCAPCIFEEINTLNSMVEIFDEQNCKIIGFIDISEYNDINEAKLNLGLNVNFPLIGIDSLNIKLKPYCITTTPALLLGDIQTGKTLYAFFSTTRHKSKDGFMEKIRLISEKK